MPNIATVLRQEIVRLAAKTARQYLEPVQRMTASHRRQLAALKRQVATLEKELKTQRAAATAGAKAQTEPGKVRFVAKGLASLRKKLGLSAEDFGRLVGVSGQSVYHWESRKTTPRKEQIAAIAAVRTIGKRQAMARLAMMPTKK